MKVVILGLGRYAEDIVEIVVNFAQVVVVEKEHDRLRSFLEGREGVENITVSPGNATDIEFWSGMLEQEEEFSVISFLGEETSVKVAKLLRKALNFRGAFLFVARSKVESREFKELEVEVISVPDVLGAILKNLLKGGGIVRYPVGIGLRRGEVAELLITQGSPAVYMKLSELRQKNTRVALIYRDNTIILPRTDIRLQPGDRLLVVGEPSSVELFVSSVTSGMSTFPRKWGTLGLTCRADAEELAYVKERIKVKKWQDRCELSRLEEDSGLFVSSDTGIVDEVFSHLNIPSLLLRGSHPYGNILLSANTDALSLLLPTVMEFAQLFNSKVFILYVTAVDKMSTPEEKEVLENLKTFVERSKKVLRLDIELIRKEGNPVRETLRLIKGKFNLLALGYKPGRKSKFFSPYTPHLLAKKAKLSTLLVPEVSFER